MSGQSLSARVLLVLALCLSVGAVAFAQPTIYAGVTFPAGDVSFADRVVSYSAASCVRDAFNNPYAVLGAPDCGGPMCVACGGCDTCAVTLGFRLSAIDDRGFLTVEFLDNRLVDVAGDDLFVFITNGHAARVEISVDGSSFTYVGDARGYPTGLDISPYAPPGAEFRFVRLSDVPTDENAGPCPGPSVDAVGGMSVVRETGAASGTLEVLSEGELTIAGQLAKNVMFVLDTSTSMRETLDGRAKIDVAKEVLVDVLSSLPEGMNVGLRIFGGCGRSRLVVPIGALDKTTLEGQVASIMTAGATPLAYTLTRVRDEDFKDFPDSKVVVLISDGAETCDGAWAPVRVAESFKSSGIDLRVHVVGFAVGGDPQARESLQQIASVTGGIYVEAESTEQLRAALLASVEIRYHVYDAQGNEVASGITGQPPFPDLPAGTYRVTFDTVSPTSPVTVEILGGKTETVNLERVNGAYTAEVAP
jgi:Mg-chelatase subunit ChlD